MPELPEVETSRKRTEKALKGKRIAEVIPDVDDHIVFDQATPEEFSNALRGARVLGTGRKGKYFWLELDRRPWPVFHLGMSGNVELRKAGRDFKKAWGGEKLWRETKRDSKGLKYLPFCRLRVVMDDETEFAITDPRRFGRIRLAEDPLSEAPISRLGHDPLLKFPSAAALGKILVRRRAPIKAVLLDQKVFAGVGNWIADEVLFHAKLSPHRLASSLNAVEVARLRTKLLFVIRRSVALNADYEVYPRGWLFHYRWGREKDAVTAKKLRIQHDTVGGRTTAWVPSLQK